MLRIFAKTVCAMYMTLMESLRYSNEIRDGKTIQSLVNVNINGICVSQVSSASSALRFGCKMRKVTNSARLGHRKVVYFYFAPNFKTYFFAELVGGTVLVNI